MADRTVRIRLDGWGQQDRGATLTIDDTIATPRRDAGVSRKRPPSGRADVWIDDSGNLCVERVESTNVVTYVYAPSSTRTRPA